ncbi:MAG: GIY-YIG nuclease family protein [Alphaproteobacteria bacterium]|nr:GIY-YIG nuclease family protein [Alphaproteobacteria bacterium]
MAKTDFFPLRPAANPTIYAYEDTNPQYAGLLKVGYTIKSAKERVAEQYPTLRPGTKPYKIVLDEPAIKENGTTFTDHDVHRLLRKRGFLNPNGEWFKCKLTDVIFNDAKFSLQFNYFILKTAKRATVRIYFLFMRGN